MQKVNPVSGANEFIPAAFGWVNDQAAVQAAMAEIEAAQQAPIQFAAQAPRLMAAADTNDPVFIHYGEKIMTGQLTKSWNQNPDGFCVGFGWTRGTWDALLWELAAGVPAAAAMVAALGAAYPNAFCVEPTYAGSRIEVGGGRIRGDGSVGAWAAKFVTNWGVLPRGTYTGSDGKTYSMESYDRAKCRQWASPGYGVPDGLEPTLRLHPATLVAAVSTGAEVWAALGSGKIVVICSNVGFDSPMDSDGFCRRSGSWSHCMYVFARFMHPRRGASVAWRNSWDDYMGVGFRKVDYVDKDGTVKQFDLPPGSFCTPLTDAASAVAQNDSFTVGGAAGWEPVLVDNMV